MNIEKAVIRPYSGLHTGQGALAERSIAQVGEGAALTPDYCVTATILSEMMDMGEMTAFEIGNATAMKFADATFDAAYSIHTAMNIADKQAVYNEAARVLKPGAALVIYDIMAEGDAGALRYPLPWASAAAESFLATPDDVAGMLAAAGFVVEARESRREFALAGLAKMMDRIIAVQGAMRGPDFAVRITNLRDGIADGLCAPWQMVARKAG